MLTQALQASFSKRGDLVTLQVKAIVNFLMMLFCVISTASIALILLGVTQIAAMLSGVNLIVACIFLAGLSSGAWFVYNTLQSAINFGSCLSALQYQKTAETLVSSRELESSKTATRLLPLPDNEISPEWQHFKGMLERIESPKCETAKRIQRGTANK